MISIEFLLAGKNIEDQEFRSRENIVEIALFVVIVVFVLSGISRRDCQLSNAKSNQMTDRISESQSESVETGPKWMPEFLGIRQLIFDSISFRI
jgi:hypothetical protein